VLNHTRRHALRAYCDGSSYTIALGKLRRAPGSPHPQLHAPIVHDYVERRKAVLPTAEHAADRYLQLHTAHGPAEPTRPYIVNTSRAPGAALASTGRGMLTVSSRTKTDTGRRTPIGMLTPDDASPLLRAQKERRNTLAARAHLAHWTGEAGDAAAARGRFAALLLIEERVLGPEHPATLTARAYLAIHTGMRGMRPGPATSSRHCRLSRSECWDPSTRPP
jgi:hypothetical protein